MEALTLAAGEGCPLCSRLLEDLRFKEDPHFPLVVYAIERKRQGLDADGSTAVGTPGIEFAETYSWRSVPWPTVEDVAKEWLRFCGEKHPRCPPLGDRPLPTRVIDVGKKDSSQVRLVISHGHLDRYIALSHCWGHRQPIITTKDNLDRHVREGIKISDLPQTFRDAIEVVRALGFQYLWIDCLCIIQRDDEDWQKEAARMPEVYANAAVTMASCVEDAFVGFLKESSWTPSAAICQFNVQWNNAGSPTTIAIYEQSVENAWHEHFYPEDGWPWNSRAWTLQESLLSARILYFASGKLFYECNTARFSRSCTSPLPLESFHEDSTIVTKTALQELDVHALMGMWYRIVADYSRRHLTKGQDRFAAISGVARIIAERVRSEYWAGLWASEFVYGLLWKSSYPIREMFAWRTAYDYNSVSQYVAENPGPSWSWAACDHGVAYPDDVPRDMCMAWSQWAGSVEKIKPDVLAVCCELLRTDIKLLDDAFGSIEKGSLTVVSTVREVETRWPMGCEVVCKPTDSENYATLGRYTTDGESSTDDSKGKLVGVPVAVWLRPSSDRGHKNKKEDKGEAYSSDEELDNESELNYFAWVLRRDNSDEATYRRVGSIEGSRLDDLQWLLSGLMTVSVLTIVALASTIVLHLYHGLNPGLNITVNSSLGLLWIVSFGLLTKWTSGTVAGVCDTSHWDSDTGVSICRQYKALFSFALLGLLATLLALAVDVKVLKGARTRGAFQPVNGVAGEGKGAPENPQDPEANPNPIAARTRQVRGGEGYALPEEQFEYDDLEYHGAAGEIRRRSLEHRI
ncbi:hypothetical protein BM1_06105 [Bipolaris maydis]|nr:hypothetical protein BM1_06105 [Bipolaris maydis]